MIRWQGRDQTTHGLGQHILLMVAPRGNGALATGGSAEDKADKDVEAADGEQEERRDQGKVVDVMREDRSTNAVSRQ